MIVFPTFFGNNRLPRRVAGGGLHRRRWRRHEQKKPAQTLFLVVAVLFFFFCSTPPRPTEREGERSGWLRLLEANVTSEGKKFHAQHSTVGRRPPRIVGVPPFLPHLLNAQPGRDIFSNYIMSWTRFNFLTLIAGKNICPIHLMKNEVNIG